MSNVTGIDLPYIEKNPTRAGKLRYYFRYQGKRICRLPDDPNAEEFSTEYWTARRQIEAPGSAPVKAKGALSSSVRPNSFRWLCLRYMASSAFKDLDDTTQTKRRQIMESMWVEPISSAKAGDDRVFGDMPFSRLDVANIEVLRDRKRETPFAANERLKILRQVFATKENGRPITANVAKMVDRINVQSDGHHTITPEEIARYIAHHGEKSKPVLAIALLMFTGFRVSDLAQIGPQHRRGDNFHLRLFKNRNRHPVDIVIPIHPVLETVLAQHQATGLAYLMTEWGRPFSHKSLGNRVSEWFTQAGLPHCTSHSVRKGLATDQAENEATEKMLDAMFGWRDPKTSRIYTARADRARLARQAVLRINWNGVGEKLVSVA